MKFLNHPINHEAQQKKIIEDTEEILNNFRKISEIMIENLNNNTMYNLGKKLINYKEEKDGPDIEQLII